MARFKYVYWCISHQQYVEPGVRGKLRDQLRCKIVRLNLTPLQRVDFHMFSIVAGIVNPPENLSNSMKPLEFFRKSLV